MKSIFAFFLLFYLLREANMSCARKEQGEYWNTMMMGQPMPESIEELIQEDPPRVSDAGKDRFSRDFDVKPNVILYHTHHVPRKQKPFYVNKLEPDQLKVAMVTQTIRKG